MNGSPLNISVAINYQVVDALKNTFNTIESEEYLLTQAMEVVRRVVSHFKYRDKRESEHSLLKDSMIIGKFMKDLLNIKVNMAGILVTRMELLEMSYHTEIAQGMLQIQQAQAKVQAREEIVKGGVLIVKEALEGLEHEKVFLGEENKQELTKSLMVLVCSDFGKTHPVLSV